MTLRTLNYGNYGIFLILGNAGFISSTVSVFLREQRLRFERLERVRLSQLPEARLLTRCV